MRRAQSFASLSVGTICELKKTSSPEYREIAGAWSEAPYFIGDRAHPRRPVQGRVRDYLRSIWRNVSFRQPGFSGIIGNQRHHRVRMADDNPLGNSPHRGKDITRHNPNHWRADRARKKHFATIGSLQANAHLTHLDNDLAFCASRLDVSQGLPGRFERKDPIHYRAYDPGINQ